MTKKYRLYAAYKVFFYYSTVKRPAVPDLLVCINPFSIIDPSLNYITKDLLQKMTMKGIPVLIISNNWSMDTEIDGEAIFL